MNFESDKMKWALLIGGILVFVVCAVLFGGMNFLGGNNTAPRSQIEPTFPPIGMNEPSNANAQIGQVVTAQAVGQGNQPVDVTSSFPRDAAVIYAVAEGIDVPAGTSIFARWSRDGQPFEDTNEITADRSYQNTYIEFHISPTGAVLAPGTYTVQFFVNGNPGPQAQFTVS